MKRKLLLMAVALVCSVGMWADVTIDITSTHITNADLSSLTGWTVTRTNVGNNYTHFTTGDAPAIEFYHTWSNNAPGTSIGTTQEYSITQSITLSPGTYRLKAYGFYREGNGNGTNTKASLKAGSNTQYLVGLESGALNSYDGDTDLKKATNAISRGAFLNTLEFTLNGQSTIDIGVTGSIDTYCSWCVVGPMSLVKVLGNGTEVTDLMITNPSFEDATWNTGWTNSGMASQTNTNFGKTGSKYAEAYEPNGEKSISQPISGLPAGQYCLSAHCKARDVTSAKIFAGSNETPITIADVEAEYFVYFTNNGSSNVSIGFQGVGTKVSTSWLAVDNFQLKYYNVGATLDDVAETFSSGSAVSVGAWYKLTTGNSSDAYVLSSSGDATITYTTDGTVTDLTSITNTWTLHAKRNAVLAPNTTYYIKSSAAVTLTKSETSVTSGYVSGWTKVTSVSQLQTNPENYFFAIFSANNTDLMLKNRTTTNDEKPVYATAANPLSSAEYLFEIENYDSKFALKSVLSGKYFENRSTDNTRFDKDGPWNYHADLATKDANCKTTLSWVNNAFVIQTANDNGGNDYLGLWYDGNNDSGYVNNEILAGNKPEASKGSFIIYCISKYNLNMTSLITNPSFELKSAGTNQDAVVTSDGGTALSIYGWTENLNGINNLRNSDWVNSSTMGTSSKFANAITSADGTWHYYARKGWSNSNTVDISLTSNEMTLPKGHYELSYQYLLEENYRDHDPSSGSFLTLKVMNGATQVAAQESSKANTRKSDPATYTDTSWKTSSVSFNVTDETLTVTAVLALSPRGGVNTEVHVDNFNLTYSPFAETADYTALATAITTAEAKTLGFETGEYAPYNNVAALTALATAKAINPSVANGKNTVQTATTALTSASWTANADDVDAICNGDFSDGYWSNDTWYPDGWKVVDGWSAKVDDAKSSTGHGDYKQPGSIQYGSQGVYTMPLAESQLYKLTFKYGYRDKNATPKISVLNGSGEGLAATSCETVYSGNEYKTAMISQTMYFTTGDAGDYVLNMATDQNIIFSDVSLVKAAESEITLSETTSFAPATSTYYQTLKLDRMFPTDKYSTMVLPFAMDASATTAAFDDEVYTLSGVEGSSLKLAKATTITKGTPYIVKAKNATLATSNIKSSDLASSVTNTVVKTGDP